jgi:hypothetical protein
MYETYKLLWNIRHQDYMNKNKRELPFEKVVARSSVVEVVFSVRSAPRNNMGAVFSGRGPCLGYITKSEYFRKECR